MAIDRDPLWQPSTASDPASDPLNADISVDLEIGPDAAGLFSSTDLKTDMAGQYVKIVAQHAVSGLGNKAYFVYDTANFGNDGDGGTLVLDGDAELKITYGGFIEGDVSNDRPVSQVLPMNKSPNADRPAPLRRSKISEYAGG